MQLIGVAFGGYLSHMGGAYLNGANALIEGSRELPNPILQCEDTMRSLDLEEGHHPTMPVPWF